MKKKFAIGLFLLLIFLSFKIMATEILKSPNGKIELEFYLDNEYEPVYNVKYKSSYVIYPSTLGLTFSEGGYLGKDLSVKNVTKKSEWENYKLISGKTSKAKSEFNELVISLEEKVNLKRKIDLILRVYNEGIAIRYFIPDQDGIKDYEILNEHTNFNFKEDHICWPMIVPTYKSNYEEFYSKYHINEINPEHIISLPLTIKLNNNNYVCITEANLNDYAGMYLKKVKDKNNIFTTSLSPLIDNSSVLVKAKPNHRSPWRVIMIGETPGQLIESDLVSHLNNSSVLKGISWIKPGKCAWNWWADNVVKDPSIKAGMNTETVNYYIDFASEYKLEYMLVDAGWYGPHDDTLADITKTIPEIDMPAIIRHAKSKNVEVILWVNWKNTRDQMDKTFPLYKEWGVKGIKMDYMDRDDQEMVNFYLKVVKLAMENKLMVSMHGAHKPTGLSRTYPNLMTYEAVRGMEYNKWDRTTPAHHVTIPFTRMLAGPMDVTPGAFRNVREDEYFSRNTEAMVIGTRCSQLAMFVVYESALQSVCDYPDAYRGQPEADFLKSVPASWDETRVLDGEIGEFIVISRRKGDNWFIGGLTNESIRKINFSLNFLNGHRYKALIYKDGVEANENPENVEIIDTIVSQTDEMNLIMAKGGGFVIQLSPLE